ncbi:M14 family zinc carboxypeptidase [Planctobacterium marinum]|uniref:M14 family zinc carboxypeptidase n=1 Tax=Planctobacterium marinum TaxID=1631968 RepID=UPI001E3D9F1C|nr:M14 family zinc carboxypeptidase [Planctobacterium marinum]MCC2606466.1 peptidase M14 [Planctobacterium marinum]
MTIRFLSCFFLLLVTGAASADMSRIYSHDLEYLPKDVSYDPAIPLPQEVLGHTVGEWHVRHDQLLAYMTLLAEKSERVQLQEIGRTYEGRKLIHLHISNAKNLADIESLRTTHLKNWQSHEEKRDLSGYPLVLWMGYSIHGDEPSGSNAALLLAYYLAAAQGEKIDQLLDQSVVILDPSLNPDGLARFAHWANSHKSLNLVSDPQNREHRQGWPSARTNHYWFDLNRDWLLLTHPESKARIEQFHQWRPHVLTDFHEMGTNSTYFFQPGIPSRTNPHTPLKNIELTNALAGFHAKQMDSDKRLYFTQEAFDDFYYGKGSTYPDAHGSVGILFEQASARGHLQESENGPLAFSQAIQNQFNLSLSTFAGAMANKHAMLDFQDSYGRDTAEEALDDDVAGFMVTPGEDASRFSYFLDVLQRHQVNIYPLSKNVKIDDTTFVAGESFFVPGRQAQYRLIKSLFSTQKRFKDNTFYDVSNWNIALAFNYDFTPIEKSRWRKIPFIAQPVTQLQVKSPDYNADAVAWAFNWQDSDAPALLQFLLKKGALVKQSVKAFTGVTQDGEFIFQPGAVLLPMGLQQPDNIAQELIARAAQLNVKLHGLMSGMTPQGVDLGSRHVAVVNKPEILLLGGAGVSQYEAGEVWHYLDQYVGVAPSIIDIQRLSGTDLSRYSHIIAVDGNYRSITDKSNEKIKVWLEQGGVLITQKRAAEWAAEQDWLKAKFKDDDAIDAAFDTSKLGFADQEALSGKKRVAGAVFNTNVDLSHPLLFGFDKTTLPVFRNSTVIMRKASEPFVSPVIYQKAPLLAGYASDEIESLIADSSMLIAHTKGDGRVIAFSDNVSFRGYWLGTRRLLSNAIYLSHFIDVEG